MNALEFVYFVLHVVLCVAVGWLLCLRGQPRVWRVVLGMIQFGALWNLTGLIWLGYSTVWPGEPIITGGFCLVAVGMIFFKQKLVTRRAF
ncbi:hypothetical protein BPS26883_06164 [Burkholderia pseudomultivorans]|uniref:Uncharacterized protein n=1 Tax=Burkholderia pseudomultivorans TaxID=1207504 RepID=A0A6P2QSN0_9BURK|nr:hypothetical protein [Burkholderia pseudomultivorans]VWC26584.1 hypothetical protein BPS26883_06164 [Burkholderia pseudomultivorans]